MVRTSSLKQTHSGWSALTGWFTWTMVLVGLTRPSTKPSWIPSASDKGSPRANARPDTTAAAARRRAAWSIRLRVPISSSGPHRPQFRTRAAMSLKTTGTGTRAPYRRARLSPTGRGAILNGRIKSQPQLREGLPMTTVRAAVCTGLNEPWKTEEIEIDPPGNREVRVKMVWSGMCHSDEHLRTGDISQTPEVLEMMGVKSMFPVVGGHEGSGIVTEVGTNVTQVAEGDHVAV